MTPRLTYALIAILIPLIISPALQAQDNAEIDPAEIPAIAFDTARKFAPGIQFTRFAYEDEGPHRVYEFSGKDADGRQIEIDVMADGSLQEIEMETPWDEIPVYIQIEFDLKAPEMEPDLIEQSIRPDGSTIYEFEQMVEGQLIEVEILSTGKAIKMLSKS